MSCALRDCGDPDCPVCRWGRVVAADAALEEHTPKQANPTRDGAPALAASRRRAGTASRGRKGSAWVSPHLWSPPEVES